MIKSSNGNNLQTGFEQISEKETLSFMFSDEKFFDIDGVNNSENERVWAINHADPVKKRRCHAETKVLREKMMM